MARGQGDYYQATRGGGHGDYRHLVLAPMDVPEAVELVQLAFHWSEKWRNPVLVFGDYFLAHVYQSVAVEPIDFGPLPTRTWALDGSTGGTGGAKLLSPLGDVKQRDDVGYDLQDYYSRRAAETIAMVEGEPALAESGYLEGADVVVVAYGTPGKYVRFAVQAMRADGRAVGYVRPISLFPFPSRAVADAAAGARAVAVYENSMGQMIDDVRLAVLGRTPIHFIGGLSMDSSGFGIGPDIDVAVIRSRIQGVLDSLPDGTAPTADEVLSGGRRS
jgi:2-oxoglutarate ferredoxin oxidoreductase subunit alpha